MDYSPRQRYLARRKAAEARRRMTLLACLGGLLIVAGLVWLLWPRRPEPRVLSPFAAPDATTASMLPAAEPAPAVSGQAVPVNQSGPAQFFHDQRLSYEPDYYVPEVQAFLDSQPGSLKTFSAPVGSRQHTFAEIVVGQSLYYSVNPKVLLALLESQGQLLSSTRPTPNQLDWAIGFRGEDGQGESGKYKGLTAQIRWAVRQIVYARRDYSAYPALTYANKTNAPAPSGWELSQYTIARVLAPTTTPDKLQERMQAFATTYARLFGDPRPAPQGWPPLSMPFLITPMPHEARVTSFFDHDGPFLSRNGGTFSYWGRNETDLSYDGHDGWDYAIAPPDPALAAAAGTVVFAGNADDNCATTAVVLDHGNGYRTLYWHLSEVRVQLGQRVEAGEVVGITGASGCAFGAHLHLGVQYLGRNTDPYGYCGSAPDPWASNPAGTVSVWLWKDRPSPCGPPPSGAIIVDTDGAGFTKTGSWEEAPIGYGGGSIFARSLGMSTPTPPEGTPSGTATAATPAQPTASVTYRPTLPAPGCYRLLAYVPYVLNGLDDAIGVTYRIQHSGGEAQVTIDLQQYANEWVDLGSYEFAPGAAAVTLDNRASMGDQSVWADAIMWLPAE